MRPILILSAYLMFAHGLLTAAESRPHVVFVMADDMGWGQTGYRGHPVLETPNLDAMASNGLRFERFYAGGPVCSPTRASVLTGRTHDRTGVLSHGYGLRLQEKTIAQALQGAGYVTGHFGKWHLNGHRGPGAPILDDDPRSPGRFGFDEWISVSNFFDVDPLLGRNGTVEQLHGDSSEVVVAEAIEFLRAHHGGDRPMFAVVWYGSPHSPFKSLDGDRAGFSELDERSADHYGELAAMDRSIGALRAALRELEIADNTLLVFCSDNGGLRGISPDTVGGLRGFKGTVYEGGIRVPGIIEWPAVIEPRVTSYPACVMDLFPTVADVVGLPADAMLDPVDGISLQPLFDSELESRGRPIGFRYGTKRALVGDRYKILAEDIAEGRFEVYDLVDDPHEERDLTAAQPDLADELHRQLLEWDAGVDRSFAGQDYPEGHVSPPDPEPVNWYELPAYRPYLQEWRQRWEFRRYLNRPRARPRS